MVSPSCLKVVSLGSFWAGEGKQNTHSKDRRESGMPLIAWVQLTVSPCPLPTLHTSSIDPTISEAPPICNVPWAVIKGFYYQGVGFLCVCVCLPDCLGDRYHSNSIGTCKWKHIWGGLTNSCEKKRSERQRRKGKIYPSKCRVPDNNKER